MWPTTISDGTPGRSSGCWRHIQPGEMVLCGPPGCTGLRHLRRLPAALLDTSGHLGFGSVSRLRLLLLRTRGTTAASSGPPTSAGRRYQPVTVRWNSPRVRFGAKGSPEAAGCLEVDSREGAPCGAPVVLRLCPDSPDGAAGRGDVSDRAPPPPPVRRRSRSRFQGAHHHDREVGLRLPGRSPDAPRLQPVAAQARVAGTELNEMTDAHSLPGRPRAFTQRSRVAQRCGDARWERRLRRQLRRSGPLGRRSRKRNL